MSEVTTAQLLSIEMPPGPEFVTELMRIWDAGNAALPIDPRLPKAARLALAKQLGVGEPVEPGDALVVATSGSTGQPKGIVLTHQALDAHARAVNRRLDVDVRSDHWMSVLPLAHIGGLGLVVRALITGTKLTVEPRFDTGRLRGNLISLVPTALDRMGPDQQASYRWIVLGGSADPADRPANVVHTYGMTESGGGVVYAGRPIDGVEVRTVDGEIYLRSPTMLRCYRDGTVPLTEDGWYPTGDLGSIDDAGILSVQGRRDYLIVTGGENVWPEPVEAALSSLPGIVDVAITGRTDPEWGTRVVAFIVADTPISLADLRAMGRERLPEFALPRELVLTERIPRTPLGKIRRSELRFDVLS